jgi:hypothetical protein
MGKPAYEHFVHDGYKRARAAELPRIRREVEQEFAERLAAADWFAMLLLRTEMRREIERRLDRIAPSDGLYFWGRR